MLTLRPSDHPRAPSPRRNPSILMFVPASPSAKPISTPMRGIRSVCCAEAGNGKAATAPPPITLKNSRLLIDTPESVLLDHLVGALLNRQRHRNVKHPGGLEIDDQLKLDRGLDRKLVRLSALENSIGVSSGASVVVDQVAAIGH